MAGLCFSADAQGPPDGNAPVTLNEYLRLAAANNAGLKGAFEQWRAAYEQIPQAKALPEPQITYGYATESTPTRETFDAMQMFPWFGTIKAQSEVASAAAKAAYKQYQARRLEMFYQVKQAFYEYNYLAKAISIAAENLSLVEHFEQVALARYVAGRTPHPDVIRAQIEQAITANRLKSLEELRSAVVAKLNGILNRPATSELPWPQAPAYEEVSVDWQQLLAIMAENNPQLQAVGYDIEAARGNEKLAAKKSYPGIGVGLGFDEGMGENGDDRVMAKVSLILPIWQNSYKAAQRQARAQVNKATQEKIQLANTLAADAKRALYEYQNSSREIRLYKDIVIPKAKEMLAASESAYQAGAIDFLSLVDAQRSLLQYQLEYEKATAENAQRLAELEMLAGTQLSPTLQGTSPQR